MDQLIGTCRKYVANGHPWAYGRCVVIVAVHRGGPDGIILRDDEEIGELRPDEVVEFAPFVNDGGAVRSSWATSDAAPDELVAWVEGN